jgi:hypothetical protein
MMRIGSCGAVALVSSALVVGALATAPSMAAGQAESSHLDLSSAPVPAGLCTHPAGHMVKGQRSFGTHGKDVITSTAFGSIRGGASAVAVIGCTAGGVAWPDTVILYRAGARHEPVIVASYDLGRLSGAEHVVLKRMDIRKGALRVVTDSFVGAGVERQEISADLQVTGGKVAVSNVHRGPKTLMPNAG